MKKIIFNQGKTKKRKRTKWSDTLITVFGLVCLVGILVFAVVYHYQQERHRQVAEQLLNASLPQPGTPLEPKLVCMVNNMYMGVDQIPITVESKTYYGCCEKCAHDLNTNESVRYATDPFSKVTVDKAKAFISINPDQPRAVLYFESEENARKYLEK